MPKQLNVEILTFASYVKVFRHKGLITTTPLFAGGKILMDNLGGGTTQVLGMQRHPVWTA